MPRKPQPDPRTLTDLLMDDETVSDEAKLQWVRALSGQDLRKPVDANAEKMDWLASKFEAEAHRRQQALAQANARRHAVVIGIAIIFTVLSLAVAAQMHML
ncbi:MAG: hypothetical protein AAFV33_22995 [Chloroflexota bacterium]